jgi:hypothetical protein
MLKGTETSDTALKQRVRIRDEPSQHVAPSDTSSVGWPETRIGLRLRRLQLETAMGPGPVVVGRVDPKHPREVSAAEHEDPVQALCPDRADPPLGVSVRTGSPDRGLDHPCALGAEHLVEGAGELRVVVPDHEPDSFEPLPHREVAGLLGDPRRVGVPGDAEDVHAPGAQVNGEQHVHRSKQDRLHR